MFSGLVEATTQILDIVAEQGGIRLVLERPPSFDDVSLGDSIAVQGCCLTVVDLAERAMGFQAGRETLAKTTLKLCEVGERLNVERSLALGERLGGHLVTGHVDGEGRLQSRSDEAEWSTMVFSAPPRLMKQMASKGSITVDGVSLTLVEVTAETFSIALIPHTLQHTTLGALGPGDVVNLETDLLAKYVERQYIFHRA
ncbi:MAG: riboflavin synthase [Planctomycetales bacterium]|nr:riboflavin synthase [Planctomycetales bacterium]